VLKRRNTSVSMETEVFLLFNTEGLSVTKDLIQQERERFYGYRDVHYLPDKMKLISVMYVV